MDFDCVAVDRLVQGAVQKRPFGSAWLRVRYSATRFGCSLPAADELELNGDVAREDLASIQVKPRLENLDPTECVARLRLPELAMVSAWMRWMSPDFTPILARWISQSSSAGDGMR